MLHDNNFWASQSLNLAHRPAPPSRSPPGFNGSSAGGNKPTSCIGRRSNIVRTRVPEPVRAQVQELAPLLTLIHLPPEFLPSTIFASDRRLSYPLAGPKLPDWLVEPSRTRRFSDVVSSPRDTMAHRHLLRSH
jgi:hypothetical protein